MFKKTNYSISVQNREINLKSRKMAAQSESKFMYYGKRVYRVLSTLLGLFILLILYNVFGVLVFHHIEQPYGYREDLEHVELDTKHDALIRYLTNINDTLISPQFDSLRNEAESLMKLFEDDTSFEQHDDKSWDYWKVVFFCVTMLTTVGYGNICPATRMGKIGVIIYSAIGIPLTVMVIARIGSRLTEWQLLLYIKIKHYCCKERSMNYGQISHTTDKITLNLEEENDDAIVKIETTPKVNESNFNLPVFVPVSIFLIYIFLGGVMYSVLEDWDYVDALYFVFVSLTTIGFGDFLPSDDRFYIETSIYIFIGLILISTCINTIVQKYVLPNMAVDIIRKQAIYSNIASCQIQNEETN